MKLSSRVMAAAAAGVTLATAGAVAASAATASAPARHAPLARSVRPATARPAVGPVPRGFKPLSVTFVSASEGWVLGTAPCAHAPCTSVVRTTNGGRSWVGIPAPRFHLASFELGAGLALMRFADANDGFAFGSQLWVTHNGGARWYRVRQVPGDIVDLEASAGQVYAASLTPGKLTIYRSPAGRDSWHRVSGLPVTNGFSGPNVITLHGRAAWIMLDTGRIYASQNGRSWVRESFRCPREFGIASVAAYSARRITALCAGDAGLGHTEKVVYASANGGGRFTRVGTAPTGGDGGILAEPTPQHLFIATASAGSWVYGSTDGGAHWRARLSLLDGGKPWSDFGFTTTSQGVAIEGTPQMGSRMFISRDGGVTWHRIRF